MMHWLGVDRNCKHRTRTESYSSGSRLAVDPEGDPGDDNDKITGQVDLQEIIPDLSLEVDEDK